ncbi:MAG: hypothetical protein N2513_06560 [Deltaproteobacteria bacterium]|nr:hypothetical protein [Deltaproteobacteria bacterium]
MTKREKELIEKGWERRMVACEPKLSEIIELYKEIGFEVHTEPLWDVEQSDISECDNEECMACYELDKEKYRIIYTRRKSNDLD